MPETTRDISGFGVPDAAALPFGKNYLLAIGIDRYQYCRPLANAVRDARALVAVLTSRFRFEPQNVIELYDAEATEANILNAFRDLVRTLTPADNLLVFFSGHGEYDDVLKEGYWIPVDARPGAFNEYFPNARLTTILNAMQARHIVLIADSCFSGALFMQYRSSGTAPLERLERDPSRWGLTSGRQEPVADGEPGRHSPFAESLIYHLKHARKPLPIAELCQRVTEDVLAASQQAPRGEPLRVAGHRGGQFVFHLREERKQQPLSASADQPLRTGTGHLMYNIPSQMETGRDTRCEVRIAFDRAAVLEGIAEPDDVAVRELRISNVMAVELIDPSPDDEAHPFRIRSISSTEQFIDEEGYTQWIFYVKALREGVFPLVLKVSVVEIIAGKERRREIVLEETVEVRAHIEEPAPASYKRAKGMVFAVTAPVSPPAQPAMEEAAPAPGRVAPHPDTLTGGGTTAGGRPTASVPRPSPAAPSPEHAPILSTTREKSRTGTLTRMAAILMVVLVAGMGIWQLTRHSPAPIPADSEKQFSNKVATRIGELLAEAHRELGRTDPDFAKAKRAVEEAARLAKQEGLPSGDLESLIKKIERAQRERANRPTGIVPEKPVINLQQDVLKYIRTYHPKGQDIFRNFAFDATTFKDARDGIVYPVRTYGEAAWLGNNLKARTPLSFCYEHKEENCTRYGRLYQWAGARRACPQGWHLPSVAEWKSLLANLRSEEKLTRALQPGGRTGFGLLAGGRKEPRTGKFSGLGTEAWFWTADQANAAEAWAVYFNLKSGKWDMRKAGKDMAASCRCVKD